LGVIGLIATERLHLTIAAFLGAMLLLFLRENSLVPIRQGFNGLN
jgi:hypothetical protein